MVWTWAASSALSIFGGAGGPPPPSSAMKLAYSSSIVTRPLAAPLPRLGLKSAPLAAVLPQVAGSTPLSSSLSVPLICHACGRTPQGAGEAWHMFPPLASHPSLFRTVASSRICISFCVMALSLYLHVRVGVGTRTAEGSGDAGSCPPACAMERPADGQPLRQAPPDNHFRGASARVEDSLHKRLPLLDALLVGPAGPGARGQDYPAIAQHAGGRVTQSKPRTRTLQ